MESLKVVASALPFSNLQTHKTIECGPTLLEIVDAVIPERYGNAVGAVVFINGYKINKCVWYKVRPKPGTLVNIKVVPQGGGGGKNPLSTILALAVFVAAPYLAASIAPSLAAGATAGTLTIGQSLAFAGLKAGITVVGMMAVNAIAPPPKQRATPTESPSLMIEGARNRYNPYGSVPVYLGRNRIVPDQCAKSFTETVGNQQYVRQLFMMGYGEQVQIEDLRIGDTPLFNFRNVDTEAFLTGNLHQGGRLWQNSVNQEGFNILVSNAAGWIQRTLPANSNAVVVDFTFPGGLNSRDSKGGRNSARVQLQVEYRTVGSSTWIGGLAYQTIPQQTFTNILNPAWSSGSILFFLDKASGTIGNTLQSVGNANLPTFVNPNHVLLSQVSWTTTFNRFNQATRNYTLTDLRNPALFGNVIQDSSSFITTRSGDSVTISSGAWAADPLDITSNTAELFIRSHWIPFPSAGDYEIRFRRISPDVDLDTETNRVYFTSSKAYRFTRPVTATGLNGFALRMQATEQLNGAVDQFNYIGTSIVPDYSPWLDDWSVSRATRNPASLYLYVLRGAANAKPVPDSQIVWDKFVEWWEYCTDRGYTCDLPVDYDTSVEDVLQLIAASGSASPDLIDGKRSVVIDRAGKDIVQMVTPRNSWGYSGNMIYPKLPHAFRVTFRNEQRGYLSDERIVYTDGYDASNASLFEELQLPTCTNPDLAYRHARRYLATAILRPETHSFSMDFENLVMTRGDRIKFQNDIPLIGIGYARIKDIIPNSSGDIESIVLDDIITFPETGTFFVRVRFDDGSQLYREIYGTIGDTHVITFVQPLDPVDTPAIGNLVGVTTAGGELDLIVKSITPQTDETARIVCVNYAPEIFDAETGTIPPFESNITPPLSFLQPNPPILLGSQSDESVMIRNIDGTFTSQAVFTLSNTNENTVMVDVVYKASGDSEWLKPKILSPSPESVAITDLEDGRRYDIWIRYKRQGGQYSIPLQINDYLFVGNSSPPSDVTNFDIEVTGQTAIFTWDKNEDIDFSHYEIRFSSLGSGATWVTSQVLEEFVYENRITLIAQSGAYLIKAVDFSGNYSVNETVITTVGIEGVLNAVAILQEDPDFSGVKINTEVYGGGLTLGNLLPPFPVPSSQYLHDIFPSTVFDLDARMADSYGGSGTTWFNLCANPADGEAQGDYDFTQRGTQTFVGTAGSPDAHFLSSGDGGWNSPITQFVQEMHRTDGDYEYSAAFVLETPDFVTWPAIASFLATTNNNNNAGMFTRIEANGRWYVRHNTGSGGLAKSTSAGEFTIQPETQYVLIITVNSTTGDVVWYVNGVEVARSDTAWLASVTDSAQATFGLFAHPNGTAWSFPSGTKIKAGSLFNETFTDQEAETLRNFYQGRPYVGYGEGYYYFDNEIDLTDVFTSYLSASFDVGAIFKNDIFFMDDIFQVQDIFGNGENDIFQMSDIFNVNDIFGIESDDWDVILEMRTTNDDPADDNWSNWIEFTAGSHEFRAAQFRVYMQSNDPNVTPIVLRLSVNVDMPDRIERGDDLTVPVGGATINFTPAFKDIPALSILTQDGDAGDEVQFVTKTASGFEFRIYNRVSMTYVERTYDFIASGYGRVIN